MNLIKFVVVVLVFGSLIFCVVTLLQWARMSHDSETVEDTKEGSQAVVTDDSCTAQFIEIVPLDIPSDDYHRPGFIPPVFEVKPGDLDDVKQEATDESYVSGDSHYFVKEEPDDEYENDPACFTIKVSFLALIALVQLSSVCVYHRLVFSALLLFIVNRNGIRAFGYFCTWYPSSI